MSVAVGLPAALGRRLAQASGLPGPRAAGLLAGLALTAVPLTTRYAQEARPYALTTLFAVLATYALVRAVASPRWPWWVLYAAALLLAGLFRLLSVLIVAAHAVSLWWARSQAGGEVTPQIMRRWLGAVLPSALPPGPVAHLPARRFAQPHSEGGPDLSRGSIPLPALPPGHALVPV